MVEPHSVDEQVIGCDGEALDRSQHGNARGLVDVDAIDGLGIDFGDRDSESALADTAVELFALFAGELLRVFEPGAGEASHAPRKDDGGCDDGAEESTAADFVDACDHA